MASRDCTVSELRIVLLGESSSEISKLGNFILGRDAFDIEAPALSVELHSERASGNVEGRYITLINTPQLLVPQLSLDQVTARLKECLYLSAPGPHVFLLVLQSGALKKEDEQRMRNILDGPWFMKYTIILSLGKGKSHYEGQRERNKPLHLVIRKFEQRNKVLILEKIDEVVKLNGGGYLTYHTDELLKTQEEKSKKSKKRRAFFKPLKHVRIVLLGKNVSEISRVGNCILGRNAFDTETLPPSVEQHSERARGTVERRYITIISTPHLFNAQLYVGELSLRVKECMNLCAPGPHAFLLVLQPEECTLKDWDQMKIALNVFSDTTLHYTAVLTTQKQGTGEDPHKENQLVQEIIETCGGRHYQFHKDSTSSDLLKVIDKVMKKNKNHSLKSSEQEDSIHERDRRKHSADVLKETTGKVNLTPSTAVDTKTSCEEMRIVLLGKNSSETNRVGNFILGSDAFDTEAPPPSVEQHSERARGMVEGRYITLINTPHLFDPQLNLDQVTVQIKEFMSLCAPGPHLIVLVLQPDSFTETDTNILHYILFSQIEEAQKHTLVLKMRKVLRESSVDPEDQEEDISQIIKTISNKHFEFSAECSRVALLGMMEKMVEENEGSYLKWEEYEDAPQQHEQTSVLKENEQTVRKIQEKPGRLGGLSHSFSRGNKHSDVSEKLNLVLCGSDVAEKTSIADLILGQRNRSPASSSVCVRREGEVCGRLVTLVEMPALYNLSEEEMMQETLHCVSLCDPGVHAFLLVLPKGPLSKEDKREMETVQTIFGSRLSNFTVAVITKNCRQNTVNLDDDIKTMTEMYRGRICTLDHCGSSELLQHVEKMLVQNCRNYYTTSMYLNAQMEAKLKYKLEVEDLKNKMSCLRKEIKIQAPVSSPCTEGLRIVLLGKTGMGKSASGNTILGEKLFRELLSSQSVTSLCQKESAEVRGRQITVIDTPGLFDTSIPNEVIRKEIAKCITMAAPGPHVFLLVLTVTRFTQEEHEAVKMIQDLFGDESKRYTIVLFTRGDDLGRMNTTIEEFIKGSCSLQNIINQCGNRYHVFNNSLTDHSQVTALLEKIESLVKVNGGSCYTNEMFQRVEKELQEEQERILKEKEKEIEREKEDLRAKFEAEMEKLRRTIEQERQKLEKERREKEEEFLKKEAQIKKETNEELKREMDKKLKEQQEAFNEKINKKVQDHREQLLKDLEYHTQNYEREQENIRNQVERAARQQAEEEFCAKLEKEVEKARREAYEEGKRDAESSQSNDKGLVHILGEKAGIVAGAVGAAVGGPVGGAIGGLIGDVVWGYIMGKK